MLKTRIVSAVAVLVLGSLSLGAGFTGHLDAVKNLVDQRLAGLTGDLDKDQKKLKKDLTKAQKALAKPCDSLKKDIKAGRKAAIVLLKRLSGDTAVTGILNVAHSDLAGEVQNLLDAIQTDLDGLAPKTKLEKAQGKKDKAQATLAGAIAQPDLKKKGKGLSKAEAQTRARKAADKAAKSGGGGGGGGGGNCPNGRAIAANDFINFDFGGVPVSATNFTSENVPPVDTETTRLRLTVHVCGAAGPILVQMDIPDPAVGVFTVSLGGIGFVPAAVFIKNTFDPQAFGAVSTSGQIELTTVDLANGTLVGTFSFPSVLGDVTNGSFSLSNAGP